MQGMQVLIDNCPCVRIHRLLMRLEMIDEVQKDAFELILFKAFSYYKHYDISIDCRIHNYVVTLIPKSLNDGIDVKNVG